MHFETLYQEARWKKRQQQQLEQSRQEEIKQLSSMKKINHRSTLILASRVYEQLSTFEDENLINIETSIPILHATGILQAIENIESAKEKLDRGEFENSRLKDEARFVYCLWKMIDEEGIETRQLKEIVYILNEKPLPQLKKVLSDTYNHENVCEFVQTWKNLVQKNNYYKAIEKIERKNTRQSEVESQKELDQSLRERCFTNQFREIESCYLKDSVKDSVGNEGKFQKMDLVTMESNYCSKNKENVFIDRATEKYLVNRLYQVGKYRVREAQKQIEDEKKFKVEMEQCTFKPATNTKRPRSSANPHRSKSINGYEKSVTRMKVGHEKQRIEKEKKDYKPVGQNYYKMREKNIKPPKFLQRKKEQEPVLFLIEFDLGRHKVKVKVHQNDSDDKIASNLCKIYCLKQEYYDQIKLILSKERENVDMERGGV